MTPTSGSGQEVVEISRVGSGRVWYGGFRILTDPVRSSLPDPTPPDLNREVSPDP